MVFAEILKNFAFLFDRLNQHDQKKVEEIILRILSCMGDHVLTTLLESAIDKLADVLKRHDRFDTADHLLKAKDQLEKSIGKLNSRSTRTGK